MEHLFSVVDDGEQQCQGAVCVCVCVCVCDIPHTYYTNFLLGYTFNKETHYNHQLTTNKQDWQTTINTLFE